MAYVLAGAGAFVTISSLSNKINSRKTVYFVAEGPVYEGTDYIGLCDLLGTVSNRNDSIFVFKGMAIRAYDVVRYIQSCLGIDAPEQNIIDALYGFGFFKRYKDYIVLGKSPKKEVSLRHVYDNWIVFGKSNHKVLSCVGLQDSNALDAVMRDFTAKSAAFSLSVINGYTGVLKC